MRGNALFQPCAAESIVCRVYVINHVRNRFLFDKILTLGGGHEARLPGFVVPVDSIIYSETGFICLFLHIASLYHYQI